MRRRVAIVATVATVTIATTLPALSGAHAQSPLAAREATRATLLRGELDWTRTESGRRKPDEVGTADLERLTIRATLPPEGLPETARFELTVQPTGAFGGVLSFLAIDWRPLEITDLDTGAPLRFEDAPEAAEVLVRVDRRIEAGERIHLRIEAALDIPCGDPVHCQVRDEPRHLVQFGWYPVNFDFPLDDRFELTLALESAAGAQICPTGGSPEGPGNPPDGQSVAAWSSTLPGFVWGNLQAVGPLGPGAPVVWSCAAPDDGDAAARLEGVARAVFDHHAGLFGPLPVDRLTLAQVTNGTGAGLSPMQLILLPRSIWTRNGADDDALRDALLAHEVTHQHFFDAVGITSPKDAWISEGLAEYAACRFQETRQGDDTAFRLNYWGYVLGVPSETDAPLASEAAVQSRDAFEIVYQKASAVWRRLELRAGRRAVDALLQTLATRFAGSILTTAELLETTGERLGDDTRVWLGEQLERVDVTVFEARTAHGRGRNDPARLTLSLRPRRGSAEPTALYLHTEAGPPMILRVAPDNDAAPLEIPATVKWLAVDPGLETFRRVKPQPAADVNLSGVVDGMDLLDVLAGDGLRVPGADWDDRLDVNGDERVDALDAQAIEAAFGEGW